MKFVRLTLALWCACRWIVSAAEPTPDAASSPMPPQVVMVVPAPGLSVRELFTLEIQFEAPARGVDAADLLVNGAPATNVTEVAAGQFLFSFPQPPEGEVLITWKRDHGITDETATLPFDAPTWSYSLDITSPAPDVQITEFMADNRSGLHDEDGDNSDWIELFNGGETPIALDGWYLTDDASSPTKWRFPNVTLSAREYLIVFASEKNRTNVPGRLHTNFKLSANGEYLALVAPNTNILSAFGPSYPPQRTDVSYGRVAGTTDAVGYFVRPTPGARNADGGPGFAPPVQFSESSRSIVDPLLLTLSAGSNEAIVRYTLDGTMPTNTSSLYQAPIPITTSLQVRARAFQNGLLPGPPRSETFLLLSNNVVNFSSDLPVVVIHSLGKGAPTASRQNFAQITVFEPVAGLASLTNPPALATRSGIKLRGSSTEGLTKSSFAVEFWDEFNADTKRSILGLPEDSDWVLYAPNIYDPVLIHNPFIHQLSRDMGRYSSRTRFVEVYLNRGNGPITAANYNGIYVLEEKIKIAPHRVAIDALEPENLTAPDVTGGYLLKIDRLDPGDSGFSAAGQTVAYVDPKERELELPQRDPQEQYIKTYMGNFARALNSASWLDPNTGYAAYIDVDAWIDFHVLELLSGNVDAIVLSTYFHKPRGGKIVFGPHWDFDRALGSTDGRDANPRSWTTGQFFASWWGRLFRDPNFWQKWIDRYQELRQSHFSQTNMNRLIDQLADEVRLAQPRERQKWRVSPRGGSYQSEVNLMKNWLSNRTTFIDRQLVIPPSLKAPSGRVTPGFLLPMAGPTNAVILYTLDGSDPRLSGGGISPVARVYNGPLEIQENVRVVARARNVNQRQAGGPPISSPWSGPVAATYTVSPPALRLTEIMFHPAPPPVGSTNAPSDFEFLEFMNVSAAPVELSGYRLVGEVQFTFGSGQPVSRLGPGERVLIVRNRLAFEARYPGVANVAGEFQGTLDNGGQQLTCTGPLQEPIFDFRYRDSWHPLADGFGFSLVLVQESSPSIDMSVPANWRLSAREGGSPGKTDPDPTPVPHVVVNELLANPIPPENDDVEFYNPTSSLANISGWFLTDDFHDPRRFRLPDGSVVPALGYARLSTLAGNQRPFSFSKFGEQIYLFSADAAGNLTGWHHGFQFQAAEPGISFGRVLTSTGKELFLPDQAATLGAPNSTTRESAVIISEIMFAPDASADLRTHEAEYVEIANVSSNPVSLFDPNDANRSWKLRGSVEFDFPPGLFLAPGAFKVLVGFDPEKDPAALIRFRSRYGDNATASLLGPWQGHLGNRSDHIQLLRPLPGSATTSPTSSSNTPHSVVEDVVYSADAPWPAIAPGSGLALLRTEPPGIADDPQHWASALPSPGDSDTDGDGLPDAWEMRYGLNPHSVLGVDGPEGDPDNDGFDNQLEFLSGTSPRNPNSYLKFSPLQRTSGTTQLTFRTVPQRSYTIEYRDTLSSGAWRPLQRISSSSEAAEIRVTDVFSGAQRFYRLTTP